jgi:hypothetical protein
MIGAEDLRLPERCHSAPRSLGPSGRRLSQMILSPPRRMILSSRYGAARCGELAADSALLPTTTKPELHRVHVRCMQPCSTAA